MKFLALNKSWKPSLLPWQPNRPTSYWPSCIAPFLPPPPPQVQAFAMSGDQWLRQLWAYMSQDSWLSEGKKWGEWEENVWDRVSFVLLFPGIQRSFPGAAVLTCESIQSKSALLAKYACRYKEFDSSLARALTMLAWEKETPGPLCNMHLSVPY